MNAPSLRRWLWPKSLAGKAAVVFIGAFLLLIAVWFVALITTQRRLDQTIATAKSLGYKSSWEELAGPMVPDSENAAAALLEAGLLASETEEMLIAEHTKRNTKTPLAGSEAVSDAAFKLSQNPIYEQALYDADVRRNYRTTMRREDAARTFGNLQSAIAHFTSVSILEGEYAKRLIREDKVEESVRRSLRWLRITRKFAANEPWIMASYIAAGARYEPANALNLALRGRQFTRKLHDEIERESGKHDDAAAAAVKAINGLRLAELDMLAESSAYHRFGILKPLANIDAAHVHRAINDYLAGMSDPHSQAVERLKSEHPLKGFPTAPRSRVLALNLDKTLTHARRKFDESTALMRCLRVLNAMSANGEFKGNVDSLGLPPECLVDPFDGQPLRMRQTLEGPIVYSIGGDLTDDGGELDLDKKGHDVGLGPLPGTNK